MSNFISRVIPGDKLAIEICEAMNIDPDRTTRVIIDAEAGLPVKVYVQMVGDKDLLNVNWGILAEVEGSG